jgi:hypothetical protein
MAGNQFFDNQFASIYNTFFDIVAPRLEQAYQQQDPNFDAMLDELDRVGTDLYASIGSQIIQRGNPPMQYFPELSNVYQTLRDLRTQLEQARMHQDNEYQAMRNELIDREDNLEIFVRERFLKEFVGRGEPLQMGGKKHKKKYRKSRKAKRKARKTRRR